MGVVGWIIWQYTRTAVRLVGVSILAGTAGICAACLSNLAHVEYSRRRGAGLYCDGSHALHGLGPPDSSLAS